MLVRGPAILPLRAPSLNSRPVGEIDAPGVELEQATAPVR